MKNIGSPATNALKDIAKQQPSLSKAFGLKNVKGVGVINNLPSMKVQSRFAKSIAGTTNIGNLLPFYTVMYSLHRVNSKEA